MIFYQLFAIWLEINSLPKKYRWRKFSFYFDKKSRSKVVRENDFIVFYFPHYQHEKGTHPGVAIVKDEFKLIKYYEEDMIFLFNLKEDRLELKNLASINPKKVIELEQLINDYFSKHNIKLPTVNNDYKSENDMGLKYEQVKKRLMSEAYFIP